MIEKQEKVQADPNQAEQTTTPSPVKMVLHGQRIVDCYGKRDGSLAKLLEELSTEVIHENDFKNFKRIYSDVTNNSKCECGSGLTFHGCCKKNWNLLERAYKNRKKSAATSKRMQAHKNAKVKVAVVVEVLHDGSMNTRMLNESDQPIGPFELETMLHDAYINMSRANTLKLAAHQTRSLIKAAMKISDEDEEQNTKPGIITPGP